MADATAGLMLRGSGATTGLKPRGSGATVGDEGSSLVAPLAYQNKGKRIVTTVEK